jgi:diguanylate cyclase (GGDEF)-like protein
MVLTMAAVAGPAIALGATGFALGRRSLRGRLAELGAELAEARRVARTDALTGLANRLGLLEELERYTAGRIPFAVMLADLDGFKAVNDTLGHAAGDLVLVEVAKRLQLQARIADWGFAARLGGDEFVLVAGAAPAPAYSMYLAKELAKAVAEPIKVGDRQARVLASVGVVQAWPGDDVRALLRGADVAMFEAKAGYGDEDGVAAFDPRREVTDVRERPQTRLREVARDVHREIRDVTGRRCGVIA